VCVLYAIALPSVAKDSVLSCFRALCRASFDGASALSGLLLWVSNEVETYYQVPLRVGEDFHLRVYPVRGVR
jgi:hypothetical protein